MFIRDRQRNPQRQRGRRRHRVRARRTEREITVALWTSHENSCRAAAARCRWREPPENGLRKFIASERRKQAFAPLELEARRVLVRRLSPPALGCCRSAAGDPAATLILRAIQRTGTEISGARFHRAEHVKNVLHVRKTTVIPRTFLMASAIGRSKLPRSAAACLADASGYFGASRVAFASQICDSVGCQDQILDRAGIPWRIWLLSAVRFDSPSPLAAVFRAMVVD